MLWFAHWHNETGALLSAGESQIPTRARLQRGPTLCCHVWFRFYCRTVPRVPTSAADNGSECGRGQNAQHVHIYECLLLTGCWLPTLAGSREHPRRRVWIPGLMLPSIVVARVQDDQRAVSGFHWSRKLLISDAVNNILVVAVRRVALSPLCCGRSVEARLLSTLGSDQDKTMKDAQITG